MNSIDYSYRPESYFGPMLTDTRIITRINGSVRRRIVRESAGDDLSGISGFRPGEVEIARVCLNSTTYGVNSIRARIGAGRIRYGFYDEYDGKMTTGKTTRTSIRPLTLGKLLDFMFGAHLFFEMLERNFPADLEGQLSFFTGESDFYPQFHEALVEKTIEHFFNEYGSDDEESMESLFYSAPHHVEEEITSSATKTGQETEPEKELRLHWLPPDHPIYSRGYVIGGYYSNKSSKSIQETASEQKNERLPIEEEYRQAMLKDMKETQAKMLKEKDKNHLEQSLT